MKRFKVSGGAALLIASACFFGAGRIVFLALLAAAAHEFGHYAAIRLCGGDALSLRFETVGIVLEASAPTGYRSEVIIAAAGPAASAIMTAAAAYTARFFSFEAVYQFTALNLLFCVFNLLPAAPLDGGRILYAVSSSAFGLRAAERITCVVSCTVISAALCAGVYALIITKTNFTLLLAAVWLLIYYCKKGNNNVSFK